MAPQTVKQNYHMTQQFHSWIHTQNNGKQVFKKKLVPELS